MSNSRDKTRYVLIQVRDPQDRMIRHEVECFASCLEAPISLLRTYDLLEKRRNHSDLPTLLTQSDVVLIGGSGDHSVVTGDPKWLERVKAAVNDIMESGKPVFASCWGYQALAYSLDGEVVRDEKRMEVGTPDIYVTEEAKRDPLFAKLPDRFSAQIGHEDSVIKLPHGAVRLAYSQRGENQAYRIGAHVYATQFHPEVALSGIRMRLAHYRQYELTHPLRESLHANALLRNFVDTVVAKLTNHRFDS